MVTETSGFRIYVPVFIHCASSLPFSCGKTIDELKTREKVEVLLSVSPKPGSVSFSLPACGPVVFGATVSEETKALGGWGLCHGCVTSTSRAPPGPPDLQGVRREACVPS